MVVCIILHCAFFSIELKIELSIIYHHIQAEHLSHRKVSDFKSYDRMPDPSIVCSPLFGDLRWLSAAGCNQRLKIRRSYHRSAGKVC